MDAAAGQPAVQVSIHSDGVASIEMFEAVGERYWPVFFDCLRARLKPAARATLQIITVADHRFEAYRKDVDFIQKYIFPGGMLPSPRILSEEGLEEKQRDAKVEDYRAQTQEAVGKYVSEAISRGCCAWKSSSLSIA